MSNAASIKAMFDAYAKQCVEAREQGKRVEFEIKPIRGGVVYLIATISPPPLVEPEPSP